MGPPAQADGLTRLADEEARGEEGVRRQGGQGERELTEEAAITETMAATATYGVR